MLRRAAIGLFISAAWMVSATAHAQEGLPTGGPVAHDGQAPAGGNAQFQVTADVARFCTVGNPTLSNATATNNVRSLADGVLTIDALMDATTLSTRAAEFGIALEAVCNYNHRVILTSENNGLWREPEAGVVPGGFAGAVPYRASLDWAGEQTILAANAETRRAESREMAVAKPNAGSVLIDVRINEGATNRAANLPLLAGVYRDTLRVTIEPE